MLVKGEAHRQPDRVQVSRFLARRLLGTAKHFSLAVFSCLHRPADAALSQRAPTEMEQRSDLKALVKVAVWVAMSMTYARFAASRFKPSKTRFLSLLPYLPLHFFVLHGACMAMAMDSLEAVGRAVLARVTLYYCRLRQHQIQMVGSEVIKGIFFFQMKRKTILTNHKSQIGRQIFFPTSMKWFFQQNQPSLKTCDTLKLYEGGSNTFLRTSYRFIYGIIALILQEILISTFEFVLTWILWIPNRLAVSSSLLLLYCSHLTSHILASIK